MKLRISETQLNKLLLELSPKSEGVKDFITRVKETPGLLKHLGFRTFKSLEDYISDGDYQDFEELKSDEEKFLKKKK